MQRSYAVLGVLFLLWVVLPQAVSGQCVPPDTPVTVVASVNNTTPYWGEQIIYSVVIESQWNVELTREIPVFEGFWLGGTLSRDTRAEIRCWGDVSVTTIDTILFPIADGEQQILPEVLTFTTNVVSEAASVVNSNAVVVDVQPLPPDAPSGFNGAVGLFSVSAAIARSTIDEGDPFRLTVTVEGAGNLQQLDAPALPFPSDWRMYPQQSRLNLATDSRLLVGTKVFEWLIIPSTTGTMPIDAIELVFFDVNSRIYRSVTSNPLTLSVVPRTADSAPTLSLLAPEGADANLEDLLAWQLKPSLVQSAVGVWAWLALFLLPPLIFALALVWRLYQRWQRSAGERRRHSQALMMFRRRAAAAVRQPRDEGYRRLLLAVYLYFGDVWGTDGRILDQEMLVQRLNEQDIDPDLIAAVLGCIAAADEQRFSPEQSASVGGIAQRAVKVLSVVDAKLQ